MFKILTLIILINEVLWAQAVSPAAITPSAIALTTQKPIPTSIVKSYKEWKTEKVQSAIKKVTITKAQIEYKKLNKQLLQKTEATAGKDADIERLESQLKNDMYSLEVIQDLNVTDYFAIYLTKQDNKSEAYKEAAQKMTSDEVADLITAFADSVFPQGPSVTPKQGFNQPEKADKIK